MTLGFSAAAADALLDVFTADYPWIQLHVGDPGASFTANIASNSTRKQVTDGSASAGSEASTADILWAGVPTTETYTHCTRWTALSGGSCGGSGTVTGGAVTAGQDFKLPTGDVTGSLPLAS